MTHVTYVMPATIRAHLDYPRPGIDSDRGLLISGWAFRSGGPPPTSFSARTGHRRVENSLLIPRDDVVVCHADQSPPRHCGFSLFYPLQVGTNSITIEVTWADGSREQIAHLDTVYRRRTGTVHTLRRFRRSVSLLFGAEARNLAIELPALTYWFELICARQHQILSLAPQSRFLRRPQVPKLPAIKPAAAPPTRFCIVTPSFNQGAYLDTAIRSVPRSSNSLHICHAVHDGGSTDDTLAVLSTHQDRLHHYVSASDDGQAAAIQSGFTAIESHPEDIMAYLNADDAYQPGAFAVVADYFARHPEIDVVYGHRVFIDEAGQPVGLWYTPRPNVDWLHFNDYVPQETLFWRRRIWDRVGGIDPSFRFALDWDLLLRFEAAGARFGRIPRFLGQFRLHPAQKSSAWIDDHGRPEMDRLRQRTLGRAMTPESYTRHTYLSQIQSSLLAELGRHGIYI